MGTVSTLTSTCELPGGHISMEDAMRKAALQTMDYLQESVAKLSAAYLEEAERNSYA